MKRLRVSVAVTLTLTMASLAGSALPSAMAGSRKTDPSRHAMLKATNLSRLSHHTPRLQVNAWMSALAVRHSQQMADRGYLFHTANPDTYLAGVRWQTWGENVGYTQDGAVADLQKAFMQSPVHRENILNSAFRHVAVGTVSQDGVLWVTVFFYG